MTDSEYLAYIAQALKRLNDLGDLILSVGLVILFAYMCYRLLSWFTRF